MSWWDFASVITQGMGAEQPPTKKKIIDFNFETVSLTTLDIVLFKNLATSLLKFSYVRICFSYAHMLQ